MTRERSAGWLNALLRRRPPPDPVRREALARYRAAARPGARAPLAGLRFVVVDVESSGLDPSSDRLISIGAVVVRDGVLRLGEAFEVVLRQERASEEGNILVHGIGGTAQREGVEPARALTDFLAFSGGAPFVAFNADFDRAFIERATRAVLGSKPDNQWLDLAYLAPALMPARHGAGGTLDEWLAEFSIGNHARHDALADAFATAQLLLVMLAEAVRQGAATLRELVELEKAQRWLGRT